jgi:hypothetical protein
MPELSAVIVPSLRRHGHEVESVDLEDSRWHVGAATWEEIAEAFVNFEIEKARPDYSSLREKIERLLLPRQKQGVWRIVGDALKKRGDPRAAVRCYVEGLAQDPSTAYTSWDFIEVPAEVPNAKEIRLELANILNERWNDNEERNRKLIARLQAVLGAPGDDVGGTGTKNG